MPGPKGISSFCSSSSAGPIFCPLKKILICEGPLWVHNQFWDQMLAARMQQSWVEPPLSESFLGKWLWWLWSLNRGQKDGMWGAGPGFPRCFTMFHGYHKVPLVMKPWMSLSCSQAGQSPLNPASKAHPRLGEVSIDGKFKLLFLPKNVSWLVLDHEVPEFISGAKSSLGSGQEESSSVTYTLPPVT